MQGTINKLFRFRFVQCLTGACIGLCGLIAVQLPEKQPVEPLEAALVPAALGKVGPQHGPEFRFIGQVDPLELPDAVEHFRGGNLQAACPAYGGEFQDRAD